MIGYIVTPPDSGAVGQGKLSSNDPEEGKMSPKKIWIIQLALLVLLVAAFYATPWHEYAKAREIQAVSACH